MRVVSDDEKTSIFLDRASDAEYEIDIWIDGVLSRAVKLESHEHALPTCPLLGESEVHHIVKLDVVSDENVESFWL